MTRPNFFIVGAPKCGTTSLADWLRGHPEVYLSPVKEPNYYNTDIAPEWGHVAEKEAYAALFAGATDDHRAVGEATTLYLCSTVAIDALLHDVPSAKLIVALRNPVEMVRSLHEEFVHADLQKTRDLFDALEEQMRDAASQDDPDRPIRRSQLRYTRVCSLGEQVERLFGKVPQERILLIWMDEMKADPEGVFSRVCEFLGVSSWQPDAFTASNRARRMRSPFLHSLIGLGVRMKRRLGFSGSFGIGSMIYRLNAVEVKRSPVDQVSEERLYALFADDIALLERITGRDLNGWRPASVRS